MALFVHGLGTSSYLWRRVIDQLDGQRRCVAVDLPLHGYTQAAADQDFSLPNIARFLVEFCEGLELNDIDLVANDTGGAISQVFATGHPELLHTLTLTNCETHKNLPPKVLLPVALLAHMGLAARVFHPGCCATSGGAANASTAWATATWRTCPRTSRASGWNRSSPPRDLARQNQRIMTSLRAPTTC